MQEIDIAIYIFFYIGMGIYVTNESSLKTNDFGSFLKESQGRHAWDYLIF